MEDIKGKINLLIQRGLFHIFGTSIVNNIIQFLTNIFIVHLVSKNEYGVYTYANNIMSFFLLVRGLGLVSGLLQFASEESSVEERIKIYKYTLVKGNQINILLSIGLLLWSIFGYVKLDSSRIYLGAMAIVPILQWMFDYVTSIFRIKQNNIWYARITNINTVIYFFCSVIGAKMFGVMGIIIARYFAFIASILIAFIYLKEDIRAMCLVKGKQYRQSKVLMKYSVTACASNSISELLYLLDVFLIGVFVGSPAIIASYKVATQIPTALNFIPSGIMVFIYPYFASHNKDMEWIKKNYRRVIGVLAVVNGVISLVGIILAPFIVKLLWGDTYSDAILPFRILMFNYFVSGTLRIPCGNILAMLRKVNVNLIVSIVSGICNIIFDIILIKLWGSVGAAIATLLVVFVSSFISLPYLIFYVNKAIKKEKKECLDGL